jgi:rhomboid protease GluP
MNTPDPNASPAREFRVQYSGNQPARAGQPVNNTYGLAGEGRLIVHAGTLTFEGKRSGFRLGGPPRIALDEVANVDYNAASNGFLIRSKNAKDYIILWASSREDAEAIWALLPQEKTPEFLAEQEHHDRFANAMTALGTRAHVTPAIIAINVAMFIAMLAAGADLMSPSSSLLIRFGSNFRPLTWNGEEWRLLTSAFLHFGLIHIALNMYALYQGGAFVERLFGSTRYALIYLLSALAGSVTSGWWYPLGNGVGASGAIFGVYGALLSFLVVRRADIPPAMLKSIGSSTLLFCLYSLLIGAAHPLIDNAAHIGGLLAGIVTGAILARPFMPEARAIARPAKLVIAALVIVLPLAWMAQPLIAENGSQAASMRFVRDFEAFAPVEAELVRKQTDILTFQHGEPVNRLDVARRLRQEVLEPWRAASKRLLRAPDVPQEGSHSARMQAAVREYLRAREQAIATRALAFETGDAADETQARAADVRLGKTLDDVNALAREGT